MHWSSEYIGTPFEWEGCTIQGLSCWGLVCLVLEDQCGIKLPRNNEIELTVKDTAELDTAAYIVPQAQKIKLSEVKEFDVLQMWGIYKGVKLPLHCGIIIDKRKVLHVEAGTDTAIMDYTARANAWRVIGAFRYVPDN